MIQLPFRRRRLAELPLVISKYKMQKKQVGFNLLITSNHCFSRFVNSICILYNYTRCLLDYPCYYNELEGNTV